MGNFYRDNKDIENVIDLLDLSEVATLLEEDFRFAKEYDFAPKDAADAIDGFHRLQIPVVVEILADDFTKTQTFDIQANGARVAAELGADVVKAFYTENFETVVKSCPVPIVLAGGPKGADILDTAADAVRCGVKGFCFGRNLFQSEDAAERIEKLYQILHK